MKRFYLIFFVVQLNFITFHCLAQDKKLVDSLQALLKTVKQDTTKVILLNKIAEVYLGNTPDQVIKYANQSLTLAKKIAYKKGIGDSYNCLGVFYWYKADYVIALDYFKNNLKIGEETGDKLRISRAYNGIGSINSFLGNYNEALKNDFASLKMQIALGDKKGMAGTYNNIGIIYLYRANYPEALKNFISALKLNEEVKNKNWIAININNIGEVYKEQGNYSSALKNQYSALKIQIELKDKAGIANTYSNIAEVYFKQNKYQEALKNLFDGLKLFNEVGDKDGIAFTCVGIGNNYTKLHKYNDASFYLNKALLISKEVGGMENIKKSLDGMTKLDSSKGDFKLAFKHYKQYVLIRDSLVNMENTKKITQQQMQYDFDKKESLTKAEQEKKDAITQKELQRQKLVRNGFIGGFGIVLLFAGVFFRQRNSIKKGNEALQIAKERAEQSERYEQQFLANMSHEIRTPMNAVMGMTNLLINKNPREDQLNYLDGIKKSSDNLLYIINDILDLSKIESGKIELEQIDFSLYDVINQVKQTLNHKAEEKGLFLITEIDSRIPDVVIGDPVRLNQILINLAGNAIKFTEKGSVSIDVRCQVSDVRGVKSEQLTVNNTSALKFSIVDTGIGIPKDKLQTVFESFKQAHSSDTRKYGGTGLGLSISKQFVELMGGTISLESEEGSGTTFSFVVNLAEGSAEKIKAQKSPEQIDGSILNGLKILLSDDNEYNRTVARDSLMSIADVTIKEAVNGKEVIELLKKEEFDVVLMDVQMPIMDGYEAAQYIREHLDSPNNKVPVIALTASVIKSDLDKCREAGMNDYVPKPFMVSQLVLQLQKQPVEKSSLLKRIL